MRSLHAFRNTLLILLFWALLSPAARLEGRETLRTEKLADDVEYRKYLVDTSGGTAAVHIVLIRLDAIREGRLSVDAALGGDLMGRTGSVESIARREGAIASINGPYFGGSGGRTYPLGFTALHGRIAQLGNIRRPLVGIDADGEFSVEVAHPTAFVTSEAYFEPLWLWGVNTNAGANGVTIYDRGWGESVDCQGGIAVAVKPLQSDDEPAVISVGPSGGTDQDWDGEVVDVAGSGSIDILQDGYVLVFRGRRSADAERYRPGVGVAVYAYELPDGWESMRWIATLGPWFVSDGHLRDFSDETDYSSGVLGRSARSVIGVTWNDEIFFAVTTGAALNVGEAADVMIECNAREAVMCDSGSSSGMWAKGVGAVGTSRAIPLAFIVREVTNEPEAVPQLRVWKERLIRR